ncbi:MAG: tRNA lysidine(34) synthetase TilS [Acidimicrobiales bacterium]
MSAPPPPSPADLRADRGVAALLVRCTFPPPGASLVCGVSGGPDSLALLVLAVASGCQVTAVHVDHGLRAGSADEADVVARAARRFGAAFFSRRVDLTDGPNLEARARHARLAALGPGAATGHTADDQAETVLANLLRGAGVDGLAAMRPGTTHPLLALRRAETAGLCDRLGLVPVRDPSNDDPRFVRTRVRSELLPLCSAIAGRDVVPVLARQAEILGGDADALAVLASLIDPADRRAVASAPEPLARRALRAWLTGDGAYPPSAGTVERVLAVARAERLATEVTGGRRVSRKDGRLVLGKPGPDGEGEVERPPVPSQRDRPG